MSSRRDQQQEDARLRVMRLIGENAELSTRQIAKRVGVSNGSAYYIVNALIKKGFVKLDNFKKNPRKKQYVYLLTPEGVHEKYLLAFRFIKRKRLEFESLREEIKVLENEIEINSSPGTSSNK